MNAWHAIVDSAAGLRSVAPPGMCAYFRIARIRQSVPALPLVVQSASEAGQTRDSQVGRSASAPRRMCGIAARRWQNNGDSCRSAALCRATTSSKSGTPARGLDAPSDSRSCLRTAKTRCFSTASCSSMAPTGIRLARRARTALRSSTRSPAKASTLADCFRRQRSASRQSKRRGYRRPPRSAAAPMPWSLRTGSTPNRRWATATRRARSSTGRCPPNTRISRSAMQRSLAPVCGAVQHYEYFPTEGWRAGRGTKGTGTFLPRPLVVYRVCGYQEQAGGIVASGGPTARMRMR